MDCAEPDFAENAAEGVAKEQCYTREAAVLENLEE